MMMVIPEHEHTVEATLANGATICLRVQKPDLEGVVRTLVASGVQGITITLSGPRRPQIGSTVAITTSISPGSTFGSYGGDVRGH